MSPSGPYHQMIGCIRLKRKFDFWEGHRRSKVNRVHAWTQRRQYNPESIGYCMTRSCGYAKGVSVHGCKVKGWGYCPVIRQILQCHPVDISL